MQLNVRDVTLVEDVNLGARMLELKNDLSSVADAFMQIKMIGGQVDHIDVAPNNIEWIKTLQQQEICPNLESYSDGYFYAFWTFPNKKTKKLYKFDVNILVFEKGETVNIRNILRDPNLETFCQNVSYQLWKFVQTGYCNIDIKCENSVIVNRQLKFIDIFDQGYNTLRIESNMNPKVLFFAMMQSLFRIN